MTLDKTFANEIRKAGNGDGSREYKFTLLQKLKETSAALENRYEWEAIFKKYGRAIVALCVASTIVKYDYRFENSQIVWATLVLDLWTNKYSGHVSEAIINIHPAILTDKSRSMQKLTLIEEFNK
jgi:hypothetical protein